jgi:hypothetical protein
MYKEKSMADRAEELSSRRARMFPLLAIIFLTQQASYVTDSHAGRAVDHFKVGAWVVMSLALLVALYSGGGLFRGREMRDMLNDESTRANRATALSQGFLAAILTAIAGYFINQFEPVRGDEVAHLVVTIGIAVAMIRFGVLEKRAHADG